jgi:hypothetical protein
VMRKLVELYPAESNYRSAAECPELVRDSALPPGLK